LVSELKDKAPVRSDITRLFYGEQRRHSTHVRERWIFLPGKRGHRDRIVFRQLLCNGLLLSIRHLTTDVVSDPVYKGKPLAGHRGKDAHGLAIARDTIVVNLQGMTLTAGLLDHGEDRGRLSGAGRTVGEKLNEYC
jgi:hypothetical protein